MNPLFATCGLGLLTMTIGAALTPDVLPTPVVPPAIEAVAPAHEAAAPDAPPSARPTAARPEGETPRLDLEVFSRRVLPFRAREGLVPAPRPMISRAGLEDRIRDRLITPLKKRSLDIQRFSRARLPRSDVQFELEPTAPKPATAPKTDWVAFRVTRTRAHRSLDEPQLIAYGRIHGFTGSIEVRLPTDPHEVWHPLASALGRLARLR